jgi:hypothetical protein
LAAHNGPTKKYGIFIAILLSLISICPYMNKCPTFFFAKTVLLFLSIVANAKTPEQFKSANTSLLFLENKGQITDQYGKYRKDIDFKLDGKGLNMFVGNGQIHYQWSKNNSAIDQNNAVNQKSPLKEFRCEAERRDSIETYRMDVTLVGADANAEIIKEDGQNYYENYYLAQCPDDAAAHSYKKIIYKNVYPNIDWALYEKDGKLKYDFIVHEGGDVQKIKLRYDGATSLTLNNGALTAVTPFGNITEAAPYSYDAISNEEIASAFKLRKNVLNFEIDVIGHDNFVIDPSLRWGTYFGGSDPDGGAAIASDSMANVYMAGVTQSTTNIATTGAFQTSIGGSNDWFISKHDINGIKKWTTYFGTTSDERAQAITLDKAGNIYVGGYVYGPTSGLATSGAFQTNGLFSSASGGLLAKFDTAGQRLWSTYYHSYTSFGGNNDRINGVSCDAQGNVFVAGFSANGSGLASTGAFQSSLPSNTYGGFVGKFNSTGSWMWGTYYNADFCSITCDNSGNVYVFGSTDSSNGIATTGAFQTSLMNNASCCMVKFTNSGTRIWGTYYGGTASYIWSGVMTCDSSGNIYAAASTTGTNPGMASSGAYQTSVAGGWDGFIVKFNSTGQRLWGTLYGGTGNDGFSNVVLGENGDVYASGYTWSSSGIATAKAYKGSLSGVSDYFFVRFSSTGQPLYASYYGGPGREDDIGCIAYSRNQKIIYIGGGTASTSGIATTGASQSSYGGGLSDAYIGQFVADTNVYIRQPYIDTVFCVGDSLYLNYGITFPFRANNTFTAQLSDNTGSFSNPTNIGNITATSQGKISCLIPNVSGTGFRIRIIANAPIDTSSDNGINIKIGSHPANTSIGSNSPVCTGNSINLNSSSTTSGISYSWKGPGTYTSSLQNPAISNAALSDSGNYIVTMANNGCIVKDTTHVSIKPIPQNVTAVSNTPVCPGTTLNLTGSTTTSGVTWSWSGPASYSAVTQNASRANMQTSWAGTYTVTATLNGCPVSVSTNVASHITTATPAVSTNSPVCVGGTLNLTASTIAGASYVWNGPNGYHSNVQNATRTNMVAADAGIYSVTANVGGCISLPASTLPVTLQSGATPSVSAYASPSSTICTGAPLAMVAVPTNVGTPSYQWYLNGSAVNGATSVSYVAPAPNNNDTFYVMMNAGTACNTPVSSNNIIVTTLPTAPPPAAVIAANPGTDVWSYLNVSFSISSLTNGGSAPTYQWKLNGQNVNGATQNKWNSTTLKDGDSVCLLVNSSDQCATPKSALSNCLKMKIPSGVGSLNPLRGDLALYPNPNRGEFYLALTSSYAPFKGGSFAVTDVTGRTVASYIISETKTLIQLPAGISSGIYVGKFTDADRNVSVMGIVVE